VSSSTHTSGRRWRRVRRALTLALVALAAATPGAGAIGLSADTPTQVRSDAAHELLPDAAARGKVLGGFTSQGWPVVIQMTPNGKRIEMVVTGLMMTCTSGDQVPMEDAWVTLPIRSRGRVNVAETVNPSASSPSSFAGATHSLSGKFNHARTSFTGRWHLHIAFTETSGQRVDCDSGQVGVSARI
jgi:hypothetical protein